MELSRSINCKELMKLDVVDADGKEVGRIGDITFTFDKKLTMKQFILEGSRIEEFLEMIRVKPDIDPVFDASLIAKISDKIYLNTTVETLKNKLDEGAISEEEIPLTVLEKFDIIDKEGVKVGNAIDVDFNDDGSAWLTVGGGFIEETLEGLGLKSDVDIIVPANAIDEIIDVIRLGVSKDSLAKTLKSAVDEQNEQIQQARREKEVQHQITKVRLFNLRPF